MVTPIRPLRETFKRLAECGGERREEAMVDGHASRGPSYLDLRATVRAIDDRALGLQNGCSRTAQRGG